jgi:uncharacterized LabA/DUF88 family protein
MKRLVIFLDYANIDRSVADRGREINYRELLNYLADEQDGRFLVEAFCYFPIDPRNPHARDRQVEELATDGYLIRSKIGTLAGDSYKCNFDVEITMELMRIVHDIKPDIVVLCSGDGDFVPVIEYLRTQGIRVEVASFVANAGREVILKCSSFIDLEVFLSGRIDETPDSYAAA